ncbi:MAG: class II fructose-bisphosphate aldolase [Candidatus Colwellbacteria bacterium]|nr:class II fructose-bisphosphate aldolase [Candidatus Colwellbacteria bacterium]
MSIRTLKEALDWAETRKVALGHFNISESSAFKAITKAAKDLDVPIIIGTSEKEAEYVDIDVATAMVKDMRDEMGHPIFLNADHFKNLDNIKNAVRAGYDSVMFDAADEPLGTNIGKTKQAVALAKDLNRDVLVEGELGYIGESSKVLEGVPQEIDANTLPTPEEIKKFVQETGIDLVAPAVGNLHGMYRDFPNPHLRIGLIYSLAEAAGVPLVLHGGSGINNEDFVAAIRAGVRIIHINTELRVAWRAGIEEALQENKEIVPYKLLPEVEARIYDVVKRRLKLFSGML